MEISDDDEEEAAMAWSPGRTHQVAVPTAHCQGLKSLYDIASLCEAL